MAIVKLDDPDKTLIEVIENNNIIKCNLIALNAAGKDRVKFFIGEVLKKHEAAHLHDDLFLSVMELAFNAIKANYAYITVLDKVRKLLHYKADKIDLASIWKSRYMMTMYKTYVEHQDTKDTVKQIIRGESKVFKIHGKASKENRDITDEEKKEIENSLSMMNRSIKDKVKATLSLSISNNRLIIDVINDAPLTAHSLKRIEKKRKVFKKYYDEDKIGEFYMENLDESESAGFGAAMIDSRLLSWGLDPHQHFKVLSLNKKTCASLTIVL